MEMVRPEIQQYFIESNIDAFPVEREMRSVVYRRGDFFAICKAML